MEEEKREEENENTKENTKEEQAKAKRRGGARFKTRPINSMWLKSDMTSRARVP